MEPNWTSSWLLFLFLCTKFWLKSYNNQTHCLKFLLGSLCQFRQVQTTIHRRKQLYRDYNRVKKLRGEVGTKTCIWREDKQGRTWDGCWVVYIKNTYSMDLVECRVQFLQFNILTHQHTSGWVIYIAVKCFQFNYKSENCENTYYWCNDTLLK